MGADMPIPFPKTLTCPRELRAALDDARDTKRGIPQNRVAAFNGANAF